MLHMDAEPILRSQRRARKPHTNESPRRIADREHVFSRIGSVIYYADIEIAKVLPLLARDIEEARNQRKKAAPSLPTEPMKLYPHTSTVFRLAVGMLTLCIIATFAPAPLRGILVFVAVLFLPAIILALATRHK